jgi:hypothetical protein
VRPRPKTIDARIRLFRSGRVVHYRDRVTRATKSKIRAPRPARNVAEVLARLDTVVEDARAAGSRLGYFAALYRRVTRRVAQGIADGAFDDGPRMDRLDTNFANRYFAALSARLSRRPTPGAWSVAFEAADRTDEIVLQHLLLAMNAHINVDLGAATADACAGTPLDDVRRDFDRINGLLADLTDVVEGELDEVSPRIADLDALAGDGDERLAVFSIDVARDDAWLLAESLNAAPEFLRPVVARLADEKAAMLGRLVEHPPGAACAVVAVVLAAETSDVRAVIDVLARD